MRLKILCGLAILGLALLDAPSFGQDKTPAPPAEAAKAPAPQAEPAKAPDVDPTQVLRRMCDYLKSLQEFSFKGEVTDDHTYGEGKKLQFAFGLEGFVKRPDKLRLNAKGDLQNKEFFYDGKTVTMYDTVKQVYATVAMPPTIDAALAQARKDYGLKLIAAELANTNLFNQITEGVKDAVYVGEGTVFGVKCQHVAFDKERAEVQLWIEASDRPVLRKVVLTYKNVEYSPQWTAYFTDWNVSPQLADSLFTFTPPQGAEKIDFVPVPPDESAKPDRGKPKQKGGQS
jgi:hypothetical protein